MSTTAPLKSFADAVRKMKNPKGSYKTYGNEFRAGDKVYGTWVDRDGKTYHQEGIVIENKETGLWVQSQPDGGITEIKRFWTLIKQ